MWKNINKYVKLRYNNKIIFSKYNIITFTNGWGDDSSSVGFIYCPIKVYKDALYI